MDVDDRVAWREVLVVAAAAFFQVAVPVITSHASGAEPVPAIGVALLAAGVAAIPLRLSHPLAALAIAFSGTLAYATLDYSERGPIYVSLVVTFANAVVRGHRRVAIAVLIAGYLAFPWLGPALGRGDGPGTVGAVALAAWLLVLYTASELFRSRQERARAAAAERASRLQHQVANERLAIARELHDVVAHNMSLVNVQAGVALHLGDDLPAPVRESLQTIKSASKDALVELRSILGVLRHADDGERAPRAPAASLAGIDALVERAGAAGVDVEVHGDADAATLPRAVDLAAYRIVQESLTNVARHSDRPLATVTIRRTDTALFVSVLDAGTARPRPGGLPSGGNGIPGMRERAASVGGTLTAGPRLGGGFVVEARLPLPGGHTGDRTGGDGR